MAGVKRTDKHRTTYQFLCTCTLWSLALCQVSQWNPRIRVLGPYRGLSPFTHITWERPTLNLRLRPPNMTTLACISWWVRELLYVMLWRGERERENLFTFAEFLDMHISHRLYVITWTYYVGPVSRVYVVGDWMAVYTVYCYTLCTWVHYIKYTFLYFSASIILLFCFWCIYNYAYMFWWCRLSYTNRWRHLFDESWDWCRQGEWHRPGSTSGGDFI